MPKSERLVIKSEDAKERIIAKKLTLASLYEPDQAPKGTKFVYVDFGSLGKRLYRVRN